MDSDGFLRWQRGSGSAPTSCSWTLGLRWRLPRWLASGTNGAELTVEGGEHGGIGSYRANSRGRSGAEGDGEEQEHVPRGEQLAGENAGRQQIAVTKSLYDRTLIRRKQGQEPNVCERTVTGRHTPHPWPSFCRIGYVQLRKVHTTRRRTR